MDHHLDDLPYIFKVVALISILKKLIIWRILINEWIKQGLYMDKNKNMYIWKWCKENNKYGDQLTRNYRKICVNIFCCFYEFCSIWQRGDSLCDAAICFILTVNFGSRCDHYMSIMGLVETSISCCHFFYIIQDFQNPLTLKYKNHVV